MEIAKQFKEIAGAAFILLAILFGMIIMAFIFGTLGPSSTGAAVGSLPYNTSLSIQNNSLSAINSYSAGATTQFSTLAIAVTLIILLMVFAVFWSFFTNRSSSKSDGVLGIDGNFA